MSDALTWSACPEGHQIAAKLIPEHHPHLQDVAFRIVFRSKARKMGFDRHALGTAEIIKGRFAFFVMSEEEVMKQLQLFENPYQMFWMEISLEDWESLSLRQREALIDHELCHFWLDFPETASEPKLALRSHDIEEFEEIIRRHGIYRHEYEGFADALCRAV